MFQLGSISEGNLKSQDRSSLPLTYRLLGTHPRAADPPHPTAKSPCQAPRRTSLVHHPPSQKPHTHLQASRTNLTSLVNLITNRVNQPNQLTSHNLLTNLNPARQRNLPNQTTNPALLKPLTNQAHLRPTNPLHHLAINQHSLHHLATNQHLLHQPTYQVNQHPLTNPARQLNQQTTPHRTSNLLQTPRRFLMMTTAILPTSTLSPSTAAKK